MAGNIPNSQEKSIRVRQSGVIPKILFKIDKCALIINSCRCQEVKMSGAAVNGSRGRLRNNEHLSHLSFYS